MSYHHTTQVITAENREAELAATAEMQAQLDAQQAEAEALRVENEEMRVAAAEAFIAGTMCIDEAVYRKRRKEVHDDHDAITSKIGKFLPEQPPLNDDGKFAFPPDPLRLALEYLLKLGESPPAKDDGPKKKAGIPKQRRR